MNLIFYYIYIFDIIPIGVITQGYSLSYVKIWGKELIKINTESKIYLFSTFNSPLPLLKTDTLFCYSLVHPHTALV